MIIRKVTIKVFKAGNRESITHRTVAAKGLKFTRAGVEGILAKYVDKIDGFAPDQYRMVQVGTSSFNFVHIGR